LKEERVERLKVEKKLKSTQALSNDESKNLKYNQELPNTRPHILHHLLSICKNLFSKIL